MTVDFSILPLTLIGFGQPGSCAVVAQQIQVLDFTLMVTL